MCGENITKNKLKNMLLYTADLLKENTDLSLIHI